MKLLIWTALLLWYPLGWMCIRAWRRDGAR